MDVALFIASWKEVLKGLGVRGKGAPGLPRMEPWRMTGSAASFFKSASCTLHASLLLGEKNWVRGLGEGGSGVGPGGRLADLQDSKNGGLKMRSKKVLKSGSKWSPNGPQK